MTEEPEREPLPPVFLTPAELAHRWRVTPRSLERWRAQGRDPVWIRVGVGIRYPISGVLAHEARQQGLPARDPLDGVQSGEP
jgi:hypothetical protein